MIGAKPIITGCRAITVNCTIPSNNNIILIVGKFLGDVEGWVNEKCWETNRIAVSSWGTISNIIPERYLLRIDDPEIQKQIEAEQEVVCSTQ